VTTKYVRRANPYVKQLTFESNRAQYNFYFQNSLPSTQMKSCRSGYQFNTLRSRGASIRQAG